MNDLLGDVKPEARRAGGIGRFKASDVQAGTDIELGHRRNGSDASSIVLEGVSGPSTAIITATDVAMDDFYLQVSEVKNVNVLLQRHLKGLHASLATSRTATRAEEIKAIHLEMQDSITEVGRMAKDAQGKLEALDRANDAARAAGGGAQSCQDRTRLSITNSLRKKLRDLLGEFAEVRARIQEEHRDTVARRYFTVTGKKLEGEALEAMIDSGESEGIFRSALMDAGRAHVMDTLSEIQERHDACRELERKLLELHQVFLDMAVLVEAQGEMLDNIEANVSKAVDYVAAGNTSLVSAKAIQRNTRKWACCGIWILLAIVFVIVIAVLKPWETGSA
eukprot:CAMPEP_0114294110 /NCGR_PEP_ID=MMETSP0059-20121206/9950_1 /TAXON_ID=36894 /ORGANISM="Pyramimonas parkeae, Strain CCMP726" /LENGTH=335 /DNA_ID=CAMNT_0001415863 /DNA_START=69 /DNA_END=1076 /DNA_ORIENTATION=-